MMLPDDMAHTLSNVIETLFFEGVRLAVDPCAAVYIAFLNKN